MLFLLHILLMAIATMGLLTGVSVAIFFRRKKNWLNLHKTVNAFSMVGAAAGVVMAFFYVAGTGGNHINGLHQITALTAFIVALITMSLGYYQFKAKNKSAVRAAHRRLGRFALFIFTAAALLGLKLINIL